MRVAVAMSGGVDSSLAAILLKEMGHEVVGLTAKILLCSEMDGTEPRYDVCCSPENMLDAKEIARQNGFPHYILDIEEEFSKEIIDPFCKEYIKGRTPSPCINCNSKMKFKKLMETADELGCDKLATGHYARVSFSRNGRYYISSGVDRDKDQSYFLFRLDQNILKRLIFPLGEYHKSEVRKMAGDRGLHVSEKPESQEICFVPDNDYPRYIEARLGICPPAGDILDLEGNKIGEHKGIHRYTIGQRRGLGISAERPLYVVEINAEGNIIIAGYKEDLLKKGLVAGDMVYMKAESLNELNCFVKTRSTQPPAGAALKEKDGEIIVYFKEPLAGISPGQAAVFYDEEGAILGGGWIEKSF